jgi:hypothetical protein
MNKLKKKRKMMHQKCVDLSYEFIERSTYAMSSPTGSRTTLPKTIGKNYHYDEKN